MFQFLTRRIFGKLMLVMLTMIIPLTAQGDGYGKVAGTVDDNNGPLIGVNVYLEGTTYGAATDMDGNFAIVNIPAGEYTMVVGYVGYRTERFTVEVKAGETQTLDIVLKVDALGLSEVVVTGVVNPASKLASSVSISTLDIGETQKLAPRTTAEIFRTIPGVRSEASAGEGNTNITVRGVPISAGGSKYLQLQEDGLPVLQFGDIAFATADIFLRADRTVGRIEAIRGGSASTMASNSPAGIINFISKTGATKGGSISTTVGLDYFTQRTDFEYGGPIGEGLNFHAGGFFRQGEGPRTAGYTANSGGQFKMNLTKTFSEGYGRLYLKYLNDRSLAYMPMPMKVTGSNSSPDWGSINGFDAVTGTMHSPFFQQNIGTGADGNLRRSNLADGMHPEVLAIGGEFSFDANEIFTVNDKFRFATVGGRFVTPFPAQVGTDEAMAESIGGLGSTLRYADGSVFGNGHSGNGLALRIHLFDVELNNFDNFSNDLNLTARITDDFTLRAGYYLSSQNISMSWLWNSYLTDVNGEKARMLDVYAANGTKLSENGLYAVGTPFWGNLHRNYDTKYITQAPYLSASFMASDELTIDASIRLDYGTVTGAFAGGVESDRDINGDGIISPWEENADAIDTANPTAVDYEYDYFSFSAGANYQLTQDIAFFGRLSQGGAAKADRLLFAGLPYSDGTELNAKDIILQAELGYKQLFEDGGLFVTLFMANTTEEGGFEATTQKIIENDYEAFGVELEGAYRYDMFDFRGGLTYTSAEITSGDNKGNTPRRQPAVMFNLIPSVNYGPANVGLSLIGQTEAYAQDSNELVMPAYVYVNAFINYSITESLYASINGNNLLNSLGVTESEEGSIVENTTNYVRARSIAGRSVSLTLGYHF
jgi:outer membrane receptor protein involved in Fe transport